MASDSATPFDLRFVNVNDGPDFEDLLTYLKVEPRMSLCLYGLPGTGKTEFAKCLAERLGKALVMKSASSLLSKYIGETEQNIAAMFEEGAESREQSVLLLDEGDTFLRNRQLAVRSWEISFTNEFLAHMERFPGTFVCTTNLFESLDSAVLRRFQFRIRFDALRKEQASMMFAECFHTEPPSSLGEIEGLVPADFANVIRQLKIMRGTRAPEQLMLMLASESATRQGKASSRARKLGFV